MSDTKYKLSEATYFLGQMQVTKENKDIFQYNLSAYISALRSVTYFMQKEYAHIPNFSGWYESKRSQMEADPMLVFFHKQRVRTTHKNQIATQPRYQIFSPSIDTTKITPGSRISFALTPSDEVGGKPKLEITNLEDIADALVGEGSAETEWLFDDLPQENNPDNIDVLTLCNQQLEKIEVIVLECENLFIK